MRQAVLAGFVAFIVVFGAFSASISEAQQPQPAKPLQFEVAAIKPGNPQLGMQSSMNVGISLFQWVNVPLKQWVTMGLSVPDYALKAPSWLDTSRFDLNVRLPAGKFSDQNARSEMMKSLLIERFGLKWHEDLQTVSGFELVADKKVLIKPSGLMEPMQGRGWGSGPTSIDSKNMSMSMSDLAEVMGGVLGKPVIDATHLSGVFKIKLIYRPIDDAAEAQARGYGGKDFDNLPPITTAVREQLGLRLQSAKVPLKVIVVDNINRQPTEN